MSDRSFGERAPAQNAGDARRFLVVCYCGGGDAHEHRPGRGACMPWPTPGPHDPAFFAGRADRKDGGPR